VAGEIQEVAGFGENTLGALRDFDSSLGQYDLAWPPLYEFGADLTLEFAHLHGQSRLADRAVRRRSPKMPVMGERGQITKLTQGDHSNKLRLSKALSNTIGPDCGGSLVTPPETPHLHVKARRNETGKNPT